MHCGNFMKNMGVLYKSLCENLHNCNSCNELVKQEENRKADKIRKKEKWKGMNEKLVESMCKKIKEVKKVNELRLLKMSCYYNCCLKVVKSSLHLHPYHFLPPFLSQNFLILVFSSLLGNSSFERKETWPKLKWLGFIGSKLRKFKDSNWTKMVNFPQKVPFTKYLSNRACF